MSNPSPALLHMIVDLQTRLGGDPGHPCLHGRDHYAPRPSPPRSISTRMTPGKKGRVVESRNRMIPPTAIIVFPISILPCPDFVRHDLVFLRSSWPDIAPWCCHKAHGAVRHIDCCSTSS